jgi:hypothetical protein
MTALNDSEMKVLNYLNYWNLYPIAGENII